MQPTQVLTPRRAFQVQTTANAEAALASATYCYSTAHVLAYNNLQNANVLSLMVSNLWLRHVERSKIFWYVRTEST